MQISAENAADADFREGISSLVPIITNYPQIDNSIEERNEIPIGEVRRNGRLGPAHLGSRIGGNPAHPNADSGVRDRLCSVD